MGKPLPARTDGHVFTVLAFTVLALMGLAFIGQAWKLPSCRPVATLADAGELAVNG
jgi:hypothetical protein